MNMEASEWIYNETKYTMILNTLGMNEYYPWIRVMTYMNPE